MLMQGVGARLTEIKALMDYLNKTESSLKLNFAEVGILGSALSGGWSESTPMKLVDIDKSLWEINIELEDGVIKFRNGNSWNQNWGAMELFNGDALFFGMDIPVNKGYYEIELNIVDKKYSIKEVER